MAAGDPIFINIPVGVFIPQEGAGFEDGEPGQFDTGTRVYLTHKDTPRSDWPQKGQTDSEYSAMFVSKVDNRLLDCQLRELTVSYKGSVTGDDKPAKLTPGADVQMLSLSALNGPGGASITLIAPIPMPTLQREFVTITEPTLTGVSLAAAGDFLPTPPAFSITFYPDTSQQPPPRNYTNEWVLQSRTWDNSTPNTWLVRENYVYYYDIAV